MTRRPASSHFAAVAAVLLAVLWASATVFAPAALADDALPGSGQAAAPDAPRSGTDTAVGVLAAVGAIGIGGGLVVVARRKRT